MFLIKKGLLRILLEGIHTFFPVSSAHLTSYSPFWLRWLCSKNHLLQKKTQPSSLESCDDSDSSTALLHADKPLPLHKVFTYPVILTSLNYVAVVLEISAMTLLSLFLAMPLDIGALGFNPTFIGYIIGSLGLVDATFQIFFFSSTTGRMRCFYRRHAH